MGSCPGKYESARRWLITTTSCPGSPSLSASGRPPARGGTAGGGSASFLEDVLRVRLGNVERRRGTKGHRRRGAGQHEERHDTHVDRERHPRGPPDVLDVRVAPADCEGCQGEA